MSWFGSADPVSELDRKIEEATSEAIPNGELDIAVGLELTDIIRSKKVPPKQAMRSLKKRITKVYENPNLLSSTLKLVDMCVKNGGAHFIAELNSKEFADYLVDYVLQVHYDMRSYKVYSSEAKYGVSMLLLKLIKEWSLYLKDRFDPNYLERHCNLLEKQGYEFPDIDASVVDVGSNFIDSTAPPDWLDGKECMICYTLFSVMNRKHHCRACGGVFCQTHSAKSIPLVSLGILTPVRVCDDCYEIHRSKNDREKPKDLSSRSKSNPALSEEDEQIRKAIELSLQESSAPSPHNVTASPAMAPPANEEEEMDADLKAAIEASLRELNHPTYPTTHSEPTFFPQHPGSQNSASEQAPVEEPGLDFYLNIEAFDANEYNAVPAYSRPEVPPPQVQLPPAPRTLEPLKPTNEDLTAEEEDSINLFVQLMNGIKTDRSKQANIIYDKNLQELNAKVVQLKPKLNRSLRLAIEKYDLFLQMSNKISTITRLYDQFLESKLNLVYASHQISSPSVNYNHPISRQGTYQASNGYAETSSYASHSVRPVSRQSTGANRYSTGNSPSLSLGAFDPSVNPADLSVSRNQATSEGPGAYAKPLPSAPEADYGPNLKENMSAYPTGELEYTRQKASRVSLHSTPYPIEEGGSHNPYPLDAAAFPSQPNYDDEPGYPPTQTVHRLQELTTFADANHNQKRYADQNEEARLAQPLYPSEPAYVSDEEASDADSVASRYPPLAGFSDDESKVDSNEPKQHASTRYPVIDDGEDTGPAAERLSEMGRTVSRESRKFKAEPEPLIEL